MFLWTCAECQEGTTGAIRLTRSVTSSKWERVADFGGQARVGSSAFSVDDKAFVVSGMVDDPPYVLDVWQYDAATDLWAKKHDFSGPSRIDGVGFCIGPKGYVGFGIGASGLLRDLHEYDPQADSWTQKANFPGRARYLPTVFVIGQKAYLIGGSSSVGQEKDVWEYDLQANTWTRKTDFPGLARNSAVGFSLGNKGYLGTGVLGGNPVALSRDFWEYDPTTDQWTKKADFPGVARGYAQGFCLGGKITLGMGASSLSSIDPPTLVKDCWEFDPRGGTWSRVVDFSGAGRAMAVSFVIGSFGYVGLGGVENGGNLRDFWRFSQESTTAGIHEEGVLLPATMTLHQNFPNPFNPSTTIRFEVLKSSYVALGVYDLLGRRIKTLVEAEKGPGSHKIEWDGADGMGIKMPSGVYFYRMTSSGQSQTRRLVLSQ